MARSRTDAYADVPSHGQLAAGAALANREPWSRCNDVLGEPSPAQTIHGHLTDALANREPWSRCNDVPAHDVLGEPSPAQTDVTPSEDADMQRALCLSAAEARQEAAAGPQRRRMCPCDGVGGVGTPICTYVVNPQGDPQACCDEGCQDLVLLPDGSYRCECQCAGCSGLQERCQGLFGEPTAAVEPTPHGECVEVDCCTMPTPRRRHTRTAPPAEQATQVMVEEMLADGTLERAPPLGWGVDMRADPDDVMTRKLDRQVLDFRGLNGNVLGVLGAAYEDDEIDDVCLDCDEPPVPEPEVEVPMDWGYPISVGASWLATWQGGRVVSDKYPAVMAHLRMQDAQLQLVDVGGRGLCGDRACTLQLALMRDGVGPLKLVANDVTLRTAALDWLSVDANMARRFTVGGTASTVGEWVATDPDRMRYDTFTAFRTACLTRRPNGTWPFSGLAILIGIANVERVVIESWTYNAGQCSPVPTMIPPVDGVDARAVLRLMNECDRHFVAIITVTTPVAVPGSATETAAASQGAGAEAAARTQDTQGAQQDGGADASTETGGRMYGSSQGSTQCQHQCGPMNMTRCTRQIVPDPITGELGQYCDVCAQCVADEVNWPQHPHGRDLWQSQCSCDCWIPRYRALMAHRRRIGKPIFDWIRWEADDRAGAHGGGARGGAGEGGKTGGGTGIRMVCAPQHNPTPTADGAFWRLMMGVYLGEPSTAGELAAEPSNVDEPNVDPAQEREGYRRSASRRLWNEEYQQGEEVLLHKPNAHKGEASYEGPYEVLGVYSGGNVALAGAWPGLVPQMACTRYSPEEGDGTEGQWWETAMGCTSEASAALLVQYAFAARGLTQSVCNNSGRTHTGQPDIVVPDLVEYRDYRPGTVSGLRRGLATWSAVKSPLLPRLIALCTGHVRRRSTRATEAQQLYSIDVGTEGWRLRAHPLFNAWVLADEPREGTTANCYFETVDISVRLAPAPERREDSSGRPRRAAKSRAIGAIAELAEQAATTAHLTVVVLVQANAAGRKGELSVHYGDEYPRDYAVGQACARVAWPRTTQADVFKLLKACGLEGLSAAQALLLWGAPLDENTARLCDEARATAGAPPALQLQGEGFGKPATLPTVEWVAALPLTRPGIATDEPDGHEENTDSGDGQEQAEPVSSETCSPRRHKAAQLIQLTWAASHGVRQSRTNRTRTGAPEPADAGTLGAGWVRAADNLQAAAEHMTAGSGQDWSLIGCGEDRAIMTTTMTTGLAQVACTVCGATRGPMVHQGAGVYACARATAGQSVGCHWVQLQAHSMRGYTMHTVTASGAVERVKCVVTGQTRTGAGGWRTLGVAPVRGHAAMAVVARNVPAPAASQFHMAKWRPLITAREVASFLTMPAENAQLPQVFAVRRQQLPRARHTYQSLYHMRSVFRALVAAVAEQDMHEQKALWCTDMTVQWGFDINRSRMALVTVGHRAKVGTRYCVEHPNEGKLVGAVRKVVPRSGGTTLHIALPQVPARSRPSTGGYTVGPQWNSTNYERMQTGLKAVEVETVLMARSVVAQLAGLSVAPLSARVYMPKADITPPQMRTLNAAQAAAVRLSLTANVSLTQGPPGTGKTMVTAAIVYHQVYQDDGQVLVVAPSNTAATRVAEQLDKIGLKTVRLLSRSRDDEMAKLPEALRLTAHVANVESAETRALAKLYELATEFPTLAERDRKLLSKLQDEIRDDAILRADAVVCTTMMAGDVMVAKHTYSCLVIDEAAQATEPEVFVPGMLGTKRMVLVGDHKQLGPVVQHEAAARAGYGTSMFERLAGGLVPAQLLDVQYRMHPKLSAYASGRFYDGLVRDGVTAEQRAAPVTWPVADYPGYFHAVTGADAREGTSYINAAEATVVVDTVAWLVRQECALQRIGVIATYGAQVHHIARLAARVGLSGLEVHTVDSYQGEERDFMIISFVRSSEGSLRFIASPQRVCVALTRARYGRICVGNPATLERHELLRSVVQHHREHGVLVHGVVGALTTVGNVTAAVAPAATAFVAAAQAKAFRFTADGSHTPAEALAAWAQDCAYEDCWITSMDPDAATWDLGADDTGEGAQLMIGDLAEAYDGISGCTWVPAGTLAQGARTITSAGLASAIRHAVMEGAGQPGRLTARLRPATWAALQLETPGPNAYVKVGDTYYKAAVDVRPSVHIAGCFHAFGDTRHPRALHVKMRAQHRRGLFSRMLCHWRGRVVGWMHAKERAEYWRYARAGNHTALRDLVRRVRYDNGREPGPQGTEFAALRIELRRRLQVSERTGALVLRSVQRPNPELCEGDAAAAALGEHWYDAGDRRPRSGMELTDEALVRTIGNTADNRFEDQRMWQHNIKHGIRWSRTRTIRALRVEGLTREHYIKIGDRYWRPEGKCAPFYSFHVRRCACLYGMMRVLGEAATEAQFEATREQAGRVIAFYAAAMVALKALRRNAVMACLFADPGGHLEGMRRLGVSAFGVDNAGDISMAERWFHDKAHGEAGQAMVPQWTKYIPGYTVGRATIYSGDALRPEVVAAAAEAHGASIIDNVANYSTPPCTLYGPLPLLNTARRQGRVHHQAVLGTVVAQHVQDYLTKGQPFIVETVGHGGHYISGEASVTFVEGTDVGLTTGDRHAFVAPYDRPFVRDAPLRRLGQRLRATSCMGSRTVSALHPDGVPVENPWSRPCCDGNELNVVGSGVNGVSMKRLCAALGFSQQHLTQKESASKALPVLLAQWAGSQLIDQTFSVLAGTPFITFDAAQRDAGLRAWRTAVHSEVTQTRAKPVGFPLERVRIIVLPQTTKYGQHVLLTDNCELPSFELHEDGRDLTDKTAALLRESHPDWGIEPENLRFVCHQGTTVTFTSTIIADTGQARCIPRISADDRDGPYEARRATFMGTGPGRGRGGKPGGARGAAGSAAAAVATVDSSNRGAEELQHISMAALRNSANEYLHSLPGRSEQFAALYMHYKACLRSEGQAETAAALATAIEMKGPQGLAAEWSLNAEPAHDAEQAPDEEVDLMCFNMGQPMAALAGWGMKTLETRKWDMLAQLEGCRVGLYVDHQDWPNKRSELRQVIEEAVQLIAASEQDSAGTFELPAPLDRGQVVATVGIGSTRPLTGELVTELGGWAVVTQRCCLTRERLEAAMVNTGLYVTELHEPEWLNQGIKPQGSKCSGRFAVQVPRRLLRVGDVLARPAEKEPQQVAAGSFIVFAGSGEEANTGTATATRPETEEGSELCFITAGTTEEVTRLQEKYQERRRKVLQGTKYAEEENPFESPKAPRDMDGGVSTTTVAILLLTTPTGHIIAQARDEQSLSAFEGIIPELSGHRRRVALRGGDKKTAGLKRSVRHVLEEAIEPALGGCIAEATVQQLIAEATAAPPVAMCTRTHISTDYEGLGRGLAAVSREIDYHVYAVELPETCCGRSWTDPAPPREENNTRLHTSVLFRTAAGSGSTRSAVPTGAAAATQRTGMLPYAYSAPAEFGTTATQVMAVGSLWHCNGEQFVTHLANTGRKQLSMAVAEALTPRGRHPPGQGNAADAALVAMAASPKLCWWVDLAASLGEQPARLRDGPCIPLSHEAIEQLLSHGGMMYCIPTSVLAVAGQDRGLTLQVASVETGLIVNTIVEERSDWREGDRTYTWRGVPGAQRRLFQHSSMTGPLQRLAVRVAATEPAAGGGHALVERGWQQHVAAAALGYVARARRIQRWWRVERVELSRLRDLLRCARRAVARVRRERAVRCFVRVFRASRHAAAARQHISDLMQILGYGTAGEDTATVVADVTHEAMAGGNERAAPEHRERAYYMECDLHMLCWRYARRRAQQGILARLCVGRAVRDAAARNSLAAVFRSWKDSQRS